MPNLTSFDLRDPSPPVPGDAQRAAVALRAHQLRRRRRMLQGVGALGMVAAVAVGVAALTAGGASGPGRIEAASSAPTTATVEVPNGGALAPTTFTVWGTVSNIPEGATLTLTLSGSEGTFTAIADGAGNYSMSGVPAGEYRGMYEWSGANRTASSAGWISSVVITRDTHVTFDLP